IIQDLLLRKKFSDSILIERFASSHPEIKALSRDPTDIKFFRATDYEDCLILHPFNMRCLETQFQNFGAPLESILQNVKVVDKQEFPSINEEFLRRYSFLSHLPVGTTVIFVEVDLG